MPSLKIQFNYLNIPSSSAT